MSKSRRRQRSGWKGEDASRRITGPGPYDFPVARPGALIAASFWIVRPFRVAVTWAAMIVVATWPLFLRVQGWLGGRRSAAVAVMAGVLLLILVVPLYFGIDALVGNAERIAGWSKKLAMLTVPQPPPWVETLPVVGAKLARRWQQLAAAGPGEVAVHVSPYVAKLVVWFVRQVGGIGLLLLQFLLTVVIAAVLYANGETAARGAERFARRLAAAEGENAVHLAGQAIRGVALGVVVTAIAQSALAGIGFVVAGVPFAAIVTAVMFILAVAQVGAGPLLVAVAAWVYSRRGAAWGTGFLVWAILCMGFKSFLRPLLIKRGADRPLLLIFAGVIGGLMAFGVIGLFIGPVVLAVAHTLVVHWVSEGAPPAEQGLGGSC
jgi:predicted PurR-regulated permease PerM